MNRTGRQPYKRLLSVVIVSSSLENPGSSGFFVIFMDSMDNMNALEVLQQENNSLKKELAELQYLLEMREEELNELKHQPGSIPQLNSLLEERLYTVEQMQLSIEKLNRQVIAASDRERNIEEELIQSINAENQSFRLREKTNSLQLAIQDLKMQWAEAMNLYEEMNLLQKKLTLAESELEMVKWEKHMLEQKLKNQIK